MNCTPPTRVARRSLASVCAALLFAASVARAQVSLNTAVDLALRSSPKVKSAQDEVDKARAQISEAHDVYVPSITAGAGLGQSYGYSNYPPTLFTVNAGSLVYNSAQGSYIRSANAGFHAAQLALEDVREGVAQDAALAFIALDHDLQREQAIGQQNGFAASLVDIEQRRVDAGQDTQIDLTQARLTAAQLRLAALHIDVEILVMGGGTMNCLPADVGPPWTWAPAENFLRVLAALLDGGQDSKQA